MTAFWCKQMFMDVSLSVWWTEISAVTDLQNRTRWLYKSYKRKNVYFCACTDQINKSGVSLFILSTDSLINCLTVAALHRRKHSDTHTHRQINTARRRQPFWQKWAGWRGRECREQRESERLKYRLTHKERRWNRGLQAVNYSPLQDAHELLAEATGPLHCCAELPPLIPDMWPASQNL